MSNKFGEVELGLKSLIPISQPLKDQIFLNAWKTGISLDEDTEIEAKSFNQRYLQIETTYRIKGYETGEFPIHVSYDHKLRKFVKGKFYKRKGRLVFRRISERND